MAGEYPGATNVVNSWCVYESSESGKVKGKTASEGPQLSVRRSKVRL